MSFKADTQISEPADPRTFTEAASMNGFSWDRFEGLFIPVQGEMEYDQDPYPSALVNRL